MTSPVARKKIVRPGPPAALDAGAPTTPMAATTAVKQVAHRPLVAGVSTSVGGRAVAGEVEHVRIAGRDVDVLLPKGATFAAYVEALEKSGAFSAQAEQIATLKQHAGEAKSGGPDARPTVGIVLSEPMMLVEGVHENTENIIALVEAMGCRPVLIPPCADFVAAGGPNGRERAIAAMASQLDGLVGPGGADIDPSIYGAENIAARNTNVVRDRFEAAFVKVALDCDLFGFGICRSHQLWNAAAGGKLLQDVAGHAEGAHGLRVKRRSMIFEATRQEAMRVNTLHHEVVDVTGWGFRVVGREDTGMIEATERWNGITTQFHPERLQHDPAHRALFSTVGRRAHVFQLVKAMRKDGTLSTAALVERMKSDTRFDASDIAWVRRELSRHLSR